MNEDRVEWWFMFSFSFKFMLIIWLVYYLHYYEQYIFQLFMYFCNHTKMKNRTYQAHVWYIICYT